MFIFSILSSLPRNALALALFAPPLAARARSDVQGPGDDQVLPISDQGWRLDVGAVVRNRGAQHPLLPAPLHRQRQLRAEVSLRFL